MKIDGVTAAPLAAIAEPEPPKKGGISLDPVALLEWAKQNVTGVGVAGGVLYVGSCAWHAWIHHSWDDMATAAGYLGLLLVVAGAAFRSKRAADISVTNAASSEIGRALLLDRVSPDSKVTPSSPDPAIAREIRTQLRESGNILKP